LNLSLKVHLLNDLAELLFQLWPLSWSTGGSSLQANDGGGDATWKMSHSDFGKKGILAGRMTN
jgi:hypothetical protein